MSSHKIQPYRTAGARGAGVPGIVVIITIIIIGAFLLALIANAIS